MGLNRFEIVHYLGFIPSLNDKQVVKQKCRVTSHSAFLSLSKEIVVVKMDSFHPILCFNFALFTH